MWLRQTGVFFLTALVASHVVGTCIGAPVKECKKSVTSLSQEASLEAQALTDPEENKIYHTNTIEDLSLLKKKSTVAHGEQAHLDCDEITDDETSKAKANIIRLDFNTSPKSKIIKDAHKAQSQPKSPVLVKKSSSAETLMNQKAKIQNLQASIHSNLIKLFHHLKHGHDSGSNRINDEEEVAQAKEALISEARQMTAMDHEPSPAENFLKGLGNNTLLKSMLKNKTNSRDLSFHGKEILKDSRGRSGNNGSDNQQPPDKDSKLNKKKENVSTTGTLSTNMTDSGDGTPPDKNGQPIGVSINDNKATKGNKTNKPSTEGNHQSTTVTKIKVKDIASKDNKPLTKHDPYAEIAASPDRPKLPPNIKIPKESPLIPVGLPKGDDDNDDVETSDKEEDKARQEGRPGRAGGGGRGSFMPELPLPGDFGGPSEAPGQSDLTMAGTINPDLANQNIMKSMHNEAMQAQLQDQLQQEAYEGQMMGLINRAAGGRMEGLTGMGSAPSGALGMAGMGVGTGGSMGRLGGGMGGIGGGMGGLGGGMGSFSGGMGGLGGSMGGIGGGMGGLGGGMGSFSGSMGGAMGGMRAMAGMGGGMGEMGYARGPNQMGGMYGSDPAEGMSYGRNPYEPESFRRGGYMDDESPYGDDEEATGPPMMDQQATGRNIVPMGYPRLSGPNYQSFYNSRYFDDDDQLDDEDDDDEGEMDRGTPRSRAPNPGRYEDVDDDLDDGEDHDYDRKAKIPLIGNVTHTKAAKKRKV